MYIEEHISEKISNNKIDCKTICSLLNRSQEIVHIQDLGLRLDSILKCACDSRENFCYIYLPPRHFNCKCLDKVVLYKQLNSNILMYNRTTVNKVKELLSEFYKVSSNKSCLSTSLFVEFKTIATRYRYIIVYKKRSFAMDVLTPSILVKELKNVQDVISIIIEDLFNRISIEDIKYVRVLIPINNDKLSLKYICKFNQLSIEITLLNALGIMLHMQ